MARLQQPMNTQLEKLRGGARVDQHGRDRQRGAKAVRNTRRAPGNAW